MYELGALTIAILAILRAAGPVAFAAWTARPNSQLDLDRFDRTMHIQKRNTLSAIVITWREHRKRAGGPRAPGEPDGGKAADDDGGGEQVG